LSAFWPGLGGLPSSHLVAPRPMVGTPMLSRYVSVPYCSHWAMCFNPRSLVFSSFGYMVEITESTAAIEPSATFCFTLIVNAGCYPGPPYYSAGTSGSTGGAGLIETTLAVDSAVCTPRVLAEVTTTW